jgi:hypothetical protein
MHTNKERKQIKKQRTQDFLRGSTKAYVHGAHPALNSLMPAKE